MCSLTEAHPALKNARQRELDACSQWITNLLQKPPDLAGKLDRHLYATRVNFFAAVSSALVILPASDYEVPRGWIPRCVNAARLDGSMTLKPVRAAVAARVSPTPDRCRHFPRVSFQPAFRAAAALLARVGSAICLSRSTSDRCRVCHGLADSRGEATSQLGGWADVSVSVRQ